MKTTRLVLLIAAGALASCGGKESANPPAQSQAPQPGAGAPAAPATPPDQAAAAPSGAAVFQRTCQTCHQANGMGMPGSFPPLSGSEFVSGDKALVIRLALHGLQGPITVKGQRYNNVMPPWKSLSDAEMAAVLTYVRSSFGNSASAVTAEEVGQQRTATSSRTTPWTIQELQAAGSARR